MQLHEIIKTYKDEVDNLRLYYCNQYVKILQSIISECGFADVDVVRIVDGKTGVITIDYDSYASKFPSLFFNPYNLNGELSKRQHNILIFIPSKQSNEYVKKTLLRDYKLEGVL